MGVVVRIARNFVQPKLPGGPGAEDKPAAWKKPAAP